MEAESRLRYFCAPFLAGLLTCLMASSALAANYRTENFLIHAPTNQLARAVGDAAEKYRHDLAMHWLGAPIRRWDSPCPIRVIAGPQLAAQGVTTYNRAPVRDFQMEVVGTPERILDSVLPHEVTHTVLATHFGRPLPRWADEGICTTVEHASERNKHEAKLREFLSSRRGIAMNQLFLMTEYPSDVLPMYAQGYSVCRFLIGQKDPRTFIRFLHDYMQHPSWTANVKKHYDYDSLAELQEYWLAWVAAGSGPVEKYAKVQPAKTPSVATLAGNASPRGQVAQASAAAPIGLSGPRGNRIPEKSAASLAANGLENRGNARPTGRATAAATALASTGTASSGGWYQRKRSEVVAQDSKTGRVATAVESIVPPSVRDSGRYRSAQPQPEQQISRAGEPVERLLNGGGVTRFYR